MKRIDHVGQTIERALESNEPDMALCVEQVTKLRAAICREAKPCPKCETKQVQLISIAETEGCSHWKCRHCKHKWVLEIPKQ